MIYGGNKWDHCTLSNRIAEGRGGRWGHSFVVVMGSVESGGREGQRAGRTRRRERRAATVREPPLLRHTHRSTA